ncbi:hypothetical protein GCM10023215_65510 [Pseudonocardia yuanmonensis]|uniref:Uncharacterized protein n=1 Tax=Pseudonocardia yuanmonensis TaxID=1095914 RepID=A0ABP8XUA4_9PSEU
MDRRGRPHRATARLRSADSNKRSKAYQTAVNAWRSAGWPSRAPTAAEYVEIRRCLADYVVITYQGRVSQETAEEIVRLAVHLFGPHMFTRPAAGQGPQPSPEDLLNWLLDTGLDAARGKMPETAHSEHYPWLRRPTPVAQDREVAESLFSATPEAVQTCLRHLVAKRLDVEFVIVTEYLDLAKPAPAEPPRCSQVAERLSGHRLLAGVVVTERHVEQVLLSFRNLLSKVA